MISVERFHVSFNRVRSVPSRWPFPKYPDSNKIIFHYPPLLPLHSFTSAVYLPSPWLSKFPVCSPFILERLNFLLSAQFITFNLSFQFISQFASIQVVWFISPPLWAGNIGHFLSLYQLFLRVQAGVSRVLMNVSLSSGYIDR